MKVPEDPVSIQFTDGREEAERQIKILCTRILPGWTDLIPSNLQVSPISGGISNLLVKVTPPAPLQPVAVKVFGDKTELLIDRAAEKRLLLHLNAVGFGAPVIGLFDNGRIESFLVAKTLTPEEMCDPRFIPHIAQRLRTFHNLDLDGDVAVGGAAASAVVHADASSSAAAEGPGSSAQEPSQWDAIFGWLAMAEGLSFPHDTAKQAMYDKVDFRTLRTEIEQLRRVCDRVASPRVLCHNDLLSGNILIVQPRQQQQQEGAQQIQQQELGQVEQQQPQPERQGLVDGNVGEAAAGGQAKGATAATAEADDALLRLLREGSMEFIDFEYSCYGPRGFDWGNHFNEYAGFDCVYERFPSAEQQKVFFRHYLRPGELRTLALKEGGDEEAVVAAEEAVLDRMVAEACVFALASHAYWGVWSFIQARYSPIDFDYLSYSQMRWNEYHRRKDEFLGLVERCFPQ